MAPKQRLANIRKMVDEWDRDFLNRFDRILLEGEMVDEDAKIIGVIGRLTKGSKIWKDMNRHWPKTYAEFRERAGIIMTINEELAREMGADKGKKAATSEQKRWTSKKAGGREYKVSENKASEYKAPENLKVFVIAMSAARKAEIAMLQENLSGIC
ncbi:hypothetical protein ACS0TY_026439 [Phlomoides rotata]